MDPKNPRSLLLVSELTKKRASPAPQIPPPSSESNDASARSIQPATSPLPSATIPDMVRLVGPILEDLQAHLNRLLTLNVSRRETVARYLDRLSGNAAAPSASAGSIDAASGLRRWIEAPRSPAQSLALQTYFEEIALITLGQAILLKAWHDRGIRRWSPADLSDPSYAIHAALKPHVPLDRENWIVANKSIYSWYKPSPELQKQIWETFESWQIGGEGPQFLGTLLNSAKKTLPERADPRGYDPRFFKAIWESMPRFGLDPARITGPIRRNSVAFCPTLRDGAVVRTGPVNTNWIGLESSCFQLMLAELMQLWWGLSSPPLWTLGNGLEAHARDQLTLGLSSPKPSLISRIAEMESCDVAFICEERAIRAQGPQSRSAEAVSFREQTDGLPYFKKIRAAGTSLGDLQACVALSKLRPGGLLWWAREEPLEARDGSEALNFILERGKLICEWNFSAVAHSLPVSPRVSALFPKFLYLFCRSSDIEDRLSHRPMRICATGQLRSHIELPLLFEDALKSQKESVTPRGQWRLQSLLSPTAQKDWTERWPEVASEETSSLIERLRDASMPLASATTIRPTPEGNPSKNYGWSVDSSVQGFWIEAQSGADGRKLKTLPLPRAPEEAQGTGLIVLVADENHATPLRHYLESQAIQTWLEQHCERRGEKWILSEPVARMIPVPRTLLRALGMSVSLNAANAQDRDSTPFAAPLPGEWEEIASSIRQSSAKLARAREAVVSLILREGGALSDSSRTILTEIFVRATRAQDEVRASLEPLRKVVCENGKIRWTQLLDILPKQEILSVSLHPSISLMGSLPLHLPISQLSRIRAPGPGILFATESGLSLKLLLDSPSHSPLLLDILEDQLQGVVCPTWSELMQYLRLPRRLELAESAAADVLRSHSEQTKRLAELGELLSACRFF